MNALPLPIPSSKYLHQVGKVYAGVREPGKFMTFPVRVTEEYTEITSNPERPFNAIGLYQVSSDLTLCSLLDYKPDSKVAEAVDDLNKTGDLDTFIDRWMEDEI